MKLDIYEIREPKNQLTFRKIYKRSGSLADLDHPMSLEWSALHEARKKLTNESEDVLQRAIDDKREMTEDEDLAFNFAKVLLDEIEKDFERREKTGDRNPKNPMEPERKMYWPDPNNVKKWSDVRMSDYGTGKEYRSLFHRGNRNVMFSDDGFNSLGEVFQAAASTQRDQRLKEATVESRSNVIGSGVAGGFVVPEAFTEILLDKALLADEIFRPLAMVLPMQGPTLPAPMFDAEDRSGGDLFGLTLNFYPEGGDMDIQTAKTTLQTLHAHKGGIIFEESRELLQDAPAFNAKLTTLLPRVVASGLDKHFYKGSGIARPLGVINSPSVYTVTRNTASSILYADIKGLWSKLHPQCHKNAIWIVNSQSIPELLALKDDGNHAIWHPGLNGSVKDGVPQTLFGRPVLYLESAPAVGTSGDICLCDPTFYVIGIRQEIIIESSNAPGFTRDMVTFKLTLRIDGQPMFSKKIKMEDGTELSWAAMLS